jgi:putative transposase
MQDPEWDGTILSWIELAVTESSMDFPVRKSLISRVCQVHFIRAVMRKVPRKHFKKVAGNSQGGHSATPRLRECALDLEAQGYPKEALYRGPVLPWLFNYRNAPQEHWRRIHTTKLLERVNRELEIRYHAIGAFPNDAALLGLAGAILIDTNEEWITSRRFYRSGGDILSGYGSRIHSLRSTLP